MIVHGGDVWQVAGELGIPASDLLDFSANINPRGLPIRARERLRRDASDPRLLGLYPDPSARILRQALSDQLKIPPDSIVVGPGAEALLTPILRALECRRALVPIPAFSEYRRACAQSQIDFLPFALDRSELFRTPVDRFCRAIETAGSSVVLLNHPHNPSGAALDRDQIERILETADACRVALLLDEAFIDYVPGGSFIRAAAAHFRFVVLRSLTKFYGCPALRIGYAVAHPDVVRRIRSLLPAWPVTQLAIDALAEAVADREFAESSLRDNATERDSLASSLRALGIVVFPSAANFLLLELPASMPAASQLRARLIERSRILIRNCDSYEGLAPGRFVRVAVRTAPENCRLVQALSHES